MMRKIILFLYLIFGVVVSFSQKIQAIPGNLDLANATASFTSSEGNVADGTVWNSRHGSSILFQLSNATKQAYTLSFEAATNKDAVRTLVIVLDGDAEIFQKEVAIDNTGKWSTYKTFSCELPELPYSQSLTMKIELLSSPGNYTANIKNLKVEATISTSIKKVVIEGKNKRIYTIDGRQVPPSQTSHGLYVIDGKKVVR